MAGFWLSSIQPDRMLTLVTHPAELATCCAQIHHEHQEGTSQELAVQGQADRCIHHAHQLGSQASRQHPAQSIGSVLVRLMAQGPGSLHLPCLHVLCQHSHCICAGV